MIIDIHTHAWPEKISQKAQAALEGLFKVKLIADPTVKTLVSFMDKSAIDCSVICAVASRPQQVPSINDWAFGVRQKRLRVFCAMHPSYEAWDAELERIHRHGDGVKFQPEFQDFYIDDPKVFPLYKKIEALQLPVLFHCGEELSRTMLVRSSPDRLLNIRKEFPRLKLIAAHFGGFGLLPEVKEKLLGTDIYLDTAFFFDYVSPKEALAMLKDHRPDRLLFGTDFPLIDQKRDIDYIKSLSLDKELEERIFFRNAQAVLRL